MVGEVSAVAPDEESLERDGGDGTNLLFLPRA